MSHSLIQTPDADELRREAQALRALGVFGKRPDFAVAQDSVVRVYMHKLRKRLDEYYTRHNGAGRLVAPKGEYRLTYEALSRSENAHIPLANANTSSEMSMRVFIAVVALLVREFHINSQADFLDHLELDPEHMTRYRDLDLTYLPTCIASALRSIAPVLQSKSRTRVLLMS